MLKKLVIFGCFVLLGVGGVKADVTYLAQLGNPAQAACLSACNKKCDSEYRTCSMNGKAPQLMINSTCSPHLSTCDSKCNASCVK